MRRLVRLCLIVLITAGGLVSCQKSNRETAAIGKKVIGISKYVDHPALNAVEQGIQDELKELGHTMIEYNLQDANADTNNSAQIANTFKFKKVDVAIGIATPTAISLATIITKDIPVVFSAVTDPVSVGLVDDLKSGKNNVTGVSDMTPVREQIKMLAGMMDLKTLGHIYSSGEENAVTLAKITEEVCGELGIKFVSATITNASEIKQAAESILQKVDAVYVSTDNEVVSALDALLDVTNKQGIPVFSADPSSSEEHGVLGAYGFDYYNMGRVTGRIVDRILKGEKPKDIPTQFLTDSGDLLLYLNLDVAEKFNIEIDPKIKAHANKYMEDGELIVNK